MNKIITFMRESATARFLIPAGICLIAFGIVMFVINSKNQDYIKIESTVSNVELVEEAYVDADGNQVEATYNAKVKYIVGEREYEAELDNVSKYEIGDKVSIYYNPKDPSQVTMSKSMILPVIIILAGVGAVVGGIVSAVNAVKRHKNMKEQERSWENGQ